MLKFFTAAAALLALTAPSLAEDAPLSAPAPAAGPAVVAGPAPPRCPGNPDALGTARVLAIDPATLPQSGSRPIRTRSTSPTTRWC